MKRNIREMLRLNNLSIPNISTYKKSGKRFKRDFSGQRILDLATAETGVFGPATGGLGSFGLATDGLRTFEPGIDGSETVGPAATGRPLNPSTTGLNQKLLDKSLNGS
jgi:hypothetical protein